MKIQYCSHCGGSMDSNERVPMGSGFLCPSCAEEWTAVCERCGERVWEDDAHMDQDHILCGSCFYKYYNICESCGRIISIDDSYYEDDDEDTPLCESCYHCRQDNTAIHPYTFRPDPIFHGEGERFFGVELEIDGGGKISSHARSLLEIGNRDAKRIYIKADGSLDDGLEIVTHPMTPEYHRTEMPWREVMEKALALGYTSHKAKTCGLHIHVNRDSFGSAHEEQEDCISRVLFFVERFWSELLAFSRRTRRQVERWAARYGIKDCPKEVLEQAKKSCSGRYTCVNLMNRDTIEFRIFRGTLRYETLIAAVQLADEICALAVVCDDEEMAALSWPSFAAGIDAAAKPELISYLKLRRLYVNDPMEREEDD